MNFSDEKYNFVLNDTLNNKKENNHNILDCFYELINNVPLENLDNLLKEMININLAFSIKEAYMLTQNKNVSTSIKKIVLIIAYNLLNNNRSLSSHTNQSGYNVSGWITHSMLEARACMLLAEKCSLDKEKAFKMGLLHDYGRKYTQDFSHIIVGFEKLIDDGFYEEAIGALTHSFLNGNYFAVYNPSKSYVVDDNLNPIPVNSEVINNDVYRFLKNYSYIPYDRILNIADLMATAKEITSSEKRILDIEKRRKMEGKQKEFFINELLKTLNWGLELMNDDICADFSLASEKIYETLMDDKGKTYHK